MDILDHPTIAVPGKGTYVVKFGAGAQYRLEKDHHVSMQEVGERLQAAVPRIGEIICVACGGDGKGPIEGEKCAVCFGFGKDVTPGRVSPAFLWDVLSVCIRKYIHISPEDLADCFELYQIPEVSRVVMDAFLKTRWSATSGPASATATGQDKTLQ